MTTPRPAAPARDPRLKAVAWRDLVRLEWWERAWELLLPAPWLALSLFFYAHDLWYVGAPCSFFFFLTGLRLSHNAQHNCLGIPRPAHDAALFAIGALMLSSGHAVQVTHLHHHRHCLDEDDVEAWPARLPGWRAILLGPLFPWTLHRSAWRLGSPAKRRWIAAELLTIAALLSAAILLHLPALRWHIAAMLAGEWLVGFFAVWTVHHGCHPHDYIARTQRGRLKNLMTYSMLYHVEHHLFPAVPTCHLPELARRLDREAPEMSDLQVY
jgi:fatty acid desaturase